MAGRQPSFLKRQKEQKRVQRAADKRTARQLKKEHKAAAEEAMNPETVADEAPVAEEAPVDDKDSTPES